MGATALLIHGAWGSAASWTLVREELTRLGVRSRAIDMPTGARSDARLGDDVAAVRAAIDGLDGPVVLVGHSWAGMTITAASAGEPRVRALLYICAIMPGPGESTDGLMATDPHPSALPGIMRVDADGIATLDRDSAREALFNDVPAGRPIRALDALGRHPLATFAETAPEIGWREHPSVYLIGRDDRVFSADLQGRMAEHALRRLTLPAGHVPLLTRPLHIADQIAALAQP
ncbi:MAG TPA: alpha/beta fold hydrolase [Miltoncostaeaceae bacterium]|nr:alpha/beta fold hydrolase [Miltoncostaeaceae bacterium]